MTLSSDLEARYVDSVERTARKLAFGRDLAGHKWRLRGGMFETVRGWYRQGIPLSVVGAAQVQALAEAAPGREIRALYLLHLSLDRRVLSAWAEQGYPALDPDDLEGEP